MKEPFRPKNAMAVTFHVDRALAALAANTPDSWQDAYEALDIAMGFISADVHPLYKPNDAGEFVPDEAI